MKRNEFAIALAYARKALGLTQEQVSFEVGIDVTTLCKFETGRVLPSFELATALARNYNDRRIFYSWMIAKGAKDLMHESDYESCMQYEEDVRILGLSLQNGHNSIVNEMPRIIKVLHDGIIDDEEREDCDSFIQKSEEFSAISRQLKRIYEQSKKPLQDGSLVRAYN